MANLNYVQTNTFYQAGAGNIIGATSIVLTSFADIYGNVLTMADFGAKGYITLEPDTTNEEAATFTGVTANANNTYTLTGIKTTLAKSPYTETAGLIRQHSGGTKVVVTDNVAFWNTFANKTNDEVVTGRWGSAAVPSAANDYVNKSYADGLAIAGSPDSSTTVKGIGRVSVAPASATIPIFVGDNDSRVPTQGENDALVGVSGTTPATTNKFMDERSVTGVVVPYAGSAAPTGWLLCDGSAVSRTTYSALFAVTSTTFGTGNGSTTFNLPDLRSRHAIGVGTGTKVATFVSRSSNVITVSGLSNAANNEFQTGEAVLYTAASGAMTGLTTNTTYYVVRVSNTTFSLATTLANAQNGTVISLSSDGTGTQTFTQTLTARTLGDTGGEENHAMSSTELLAHTHTGGAAGAQLGPAGGGSTGSPTGSTGGNVAMNVMNPFLALNYIIKT